MKREIRFAVRTIRNGRVKILGRWFKPRRDDFPVTSGRYAFGVYGRDKDFVNLWGTEEMYRCQGDDGVFERLWDAYCKLVTKDGYFLWDWWYAA